MRLHRDGWTYDQVPTTPREDFNGPFFIRYDPPVVRRRPLPKQRMVPPATLRLKTHAIGERQGRWYVETADIVGANGEVIRDLGRIDWTDLDHDGDVLFTAGGQVHRLSQRALATGEEAKLIADLNAMRFEPIEAPAAARRW